MDDSRLKRLQQLNMASPPVRQFASPYTPPKISPAAYATQPKVQSGQPPVTPVGQRYNNVAPAVQATWDAAAPKPSAIDKGLGFLNKTAGEITHPFYQFGKMAAYTPKAVYRIAKNKPITDIQQSVFGTTKDGDIARQIIGDTAQVGLTFAVPEASILEKQLGKTGARIAGESLLGAGFGAAQAGAENGSDAKKIAKGAGLGAAVGGVLGGLGSKVGEILSNKKLISRVAGETDPNVIKALTNVDDETARILAATENPTDVKTLLKGADTTPTVSHATKIENLPSIIKDGEIKPHAPPVDGAVSPKEDTLASFFQRGAKNDYTHTGEDNAVFFMKGKNVPKGEEFGGDQLAVKGGAKISPKNVDHIEVPSEDIAKSLRKQGYKVVVNPELSAEATTAAAKAQAAVKELGPTGTNAAAVEAANPASDAFHNQLTELSKDPVKNEKAIQELIQAHDAIPTDATATSTTVQAQDAAKQLTPAADGTTSANIADPDTKSAIDSVMSKLDEAQTAADKTGDLYKAERAKRAGSALDAANGKSGTDAYGAILNNFKGELPKGEYTGIAAASTPEESQKIFATLFDSARQDSRYSNQAFTQANIGTALKKVVLGEGGYPTSGDVKLLREAFGEDFGNKVVDSIEASLTGGQKAAKVAGQILGAPRSVMASYDLSGTLRQGGTLAPRYPKEFADAVKYQLKAFGSEEGFQEGAAAIRGSQFYESGVKSGLATKAAEGISHTEEAFVSNLLDKVPGIHASDRAYSMMLSKFRQNVYDTLLTDAQQAGREIAPNELKDIAKVINTFTGRGDLGKYLEKHSESLTTALFSPRLWKSRLDMLNPVFYAKLSGPAQKVALESAASFAATASTVLGLAAMAGATVETDPRSSDFGKIKVGNTRYDILGGLQQNLVFAWREISGEKKNSETGDVTSLTDGKFGGADRLSTLKDLIQNKENPVLAAGQRILSGKDRGGNPVNPFTELANLAVPLPLSGTIQTVNDVGSLKDPAAIAKGALLNSPDLVGISAQTYGSIPTKNQGQPNAQGQKSYKGKIEPNMVTDDNGSVILDKNGKPVTVKLPKNATSVERQALLDEKRTSALKDRFTRSLSTEDQALVKLPADHLDGYLQSGAIDQNKYDQITQYQQDIKNLGGPKVPKGIKSDAAKAFYNKYSTLSTKQQKDYLNGPPDDTAKKITSDVNAKIPKGLTPFQPSNKLSKAYAEYEKDINTHPEYTELDKRNKAKAFYAFTAKSQRPDHVQNIYKEGGSTDLTYLIENGAINKDDLNGAITLDNELYSSGITDSLKFSKKFRNSYGFGIPGRGGSGGGSGGSGSRSGSSKSTNAHLGELLATTKKSSAAPSVSAKSRGIKLKSASIPKSAGNSKKIVIKL